MKVGLFGGSFNPPHLAHLLIAEAVREQFGLDWVLWIPANVPPHKQDSRLAAPAHRLRMVELATEGNTAFLVSDMELRRQGVSYTVDTIRMLQQENPDADYALMVGGDSLRGFPQWHRPEEIVERVPLLVYPRGTEDPPLPPGLPADRVFLADAPLIGISSTAIRNRRAAGRSIRYCVPDAVLQYIQQHRLYLVEPVPPSEAHTVLP